MYFYSKTVYILFILYTSQSSNLCSVYINLLRLKASFVIRGNRCDFEANMVDCNIEVSEFELHSHHYVQF